MPRTLRLLVLGLALVTVSACSSPPPSPTVTVTATARAEPEERSPDLALTSLEALTLCAARTLEPSPWGNLPISQVLDLGQVVERTDGQWYVVIDLFDPNPGDHYNDDGSSWSYCVLGGTVGDVRWPGYGGSLIDPANDPEHKDPSNIPGIDYDPSGD